MSRDLPSSDSFSDGDNAVRGDSALSASGPEVAAGEMDLDETIDAKVAAFQAAAPAGGTDVDLADGSSLLMSSNDADSARAEAEPLSQQVVQQPTPLKKILRPAPAKRVATGSVLKRRASDSASQTALFMKPMPQKRGSSLGPTGPIPSASPAVELWSLLTAGEDHDFDVTDPIQLEHFVIERLIGRGGMGAVFAARDVRLNRTVALKVLAPEHTTSASSLHRFRNEARAAARLDHDNIARVHYLGGQLGDDASQSHLFSAALPFIAFEFVEGVNVREAIRERGPFSPADTVRFALQLASALRQTDACGVVHRDIKPSNVIITPNGRAKLVDLGLARTADPDASQELTVAGTTLGTFDYISPEQAKDPRSVDVRSDIYSLGCTMFHMVVGQPPYPAGTMLQKLLDHQDRVAPDAHAINRRVPVSLSDLIRRMMDSEPGLRPQSAEELIVELSSVAHELGVRSLTGESLVVSTQGSVDESGWRQHVGWIIAAAFICLVAVFADQLSAPSPTLDALARRESADDEVVRPPEAGSADDITGSPSSISNDKGAALKMPLDSGSGTESIGPAVSRPLGPTKRSPEAPGPDGTELVVQSPSDAMTPERNGASKADERPIEAAVVSKPFAVLQRGDETLYSSFEDAIANATDGAQIEIRQGGRVGTLDREVRISERSIDIVKADGLAEHPVIRINAPLTASPTGVKLFNLTNGGRIHFYDVDLEVAVSARPSTKSWSVFSLAEGCTTELDGASVTVLNDTSTNVSVFRVASGMNESAILASVVLDRSLIRGNATLIHSDGQCSLEAQISEAAVSVSGPLLDVFPVGMPRPRPADRELSVHIEESTFLCGGSVIRVEADPEDRVAQIRATVDGSVFTLLDRNLPIVAMSGDLYEDDFETLLAWTGSKNVFSTDVAWRIRSAEGPAADRFFSDWQSHWGSSSSDEQAVMAATIAEQIDGVAGKLQTLMPKDFAVIPGLEASDRRGAGSGQIGVPWSDAGFPTPDLN